jgi:hypothetical protein
MPFELAEDHTAPDHPPALDWSHWTDDELRGKLMDVARQHTVLWLRVKNLQWTTRMLEQELSTRAKLAAQ